MGSSYKRELEMEPGQIAASYRQAVDRKNQIMILAQLNVCSVERIVEILESYGYEIPESWIYDSWQDDGADIAYNAEVLERKRKIIQTYKRKLKNKPGEDHEARSGDDADGDGTEKEPEKPKEIVAELTVHEAKAVVRLINRHIAFEKAKYLTELMGVYAKCRDAFERSEKQNNVNGS